MNRRAFLTALAGAAGVAALPTSNPQDFIVPPCAHQGLRGTAQLVDVSTHDLGPDGRRWKKFIVVDVRVHCQDCGADDLKIS